MSYVLKIRTRDTSLPRRFVEIAMLKGEKKPTEFQFVFEDRINALEAYAHAKRSRKPGDEIYLTSHEILGSV